MNNLNFVITIGREYGSGGREIGRQVAEKLRIPFYDKELIAASVRESGMDAKVFEELEERTTPSFLFSLAVGSLTPN
ncbi:MAG: cytidylate kinase-like family protein, partial [Clostridia bacterium]|nr:cytidylate kinase-like family protein [Clostridia bacterium]